MRTWMRARFDSLFSRLVEKVALQIDVRRSTATVDSGQLVDIRLSQSLTLGMWEYEIRQRSKALRLAGTKVLARCLGRYSIFLDARDVGFASHIMMDGYWEIWIARFVISRLKPGMTVVDIGANYGYYTLIMADMVGPGGRVVAFEPNPEICEELSKTVSVNGYASTVEISDQAVSDTDGERRLLLVPQGEPKNGFVREADIASKRPFERFEIITCTLDRRMADFARIDFIKVDAEGSEHAILEGMAVTLTKHKPELLLEFNAGRTSNPEAMIDRLVAIYQHDPVYLSEQGELVKVSKQDLCTKRVGEDWMLFFSTQL